MRDKAQVWTEQQERLLRAAQAAVNGAGREYTDSGDYMIEASDFEALRDIVQEIHDDAVKAIQENAERVRQGMKLERCSVGECGLCEGASAECSCRCHKPWYAQEGGR